MKRFGMSYVCTLYFLQKSIEFYGMHKECQRILIHFLLFIYHKSSEIAKCRPLTYYLPNIFSPITIAIIITTHWIV